MAAPTPQERAVELHLTLVEVLKQLNRADIEEKDVEGFERRELYFLLRKGPCPYLDEADLGPVLDMLTGNRMARRIEESRYAWDRGRLVGPRYAITLEGKEYLLKEGARAGRIA